LIVTIESLVMMTNDKVSIGTTYKSIRKSKTIILFQLFLNLAKDICEYVSIFSYFIC